MEKFLLEAKNQILDKALAALHKRKEDQNNKQKMI
jgi:hypothetical protein